MFHLARAALFLASPVRFGDLGFCTLAMDGPSKEERLKQQKRETTADLAETKRLLRDAKRQQKRQRQSEAKQWNLAPLLAHTLLIIYSLADRATAVQYLVNFGRKRHWPEKSEDEVQRVVEDLFLEVDLGHLSSLTDLENPGDAEAMKMALPYVEQWRIVAWAKGLNERQGLTPSAGSVLERLEANRAQIPEDVRPPFAGTAADDRGRQWARRFRRRWGGRHGKMRVRDLVLLPELRSKVHF